MKEECAHRRLRTSCEILIFFGQKYLFGYFTNNVIYGFLMKFFLIFSFSFFFLDNYYLFIVDIINNTDDIDHRILVLILIIFLFICLEQKIYILEVM